MELQNNLKAKGNKVTGLASGTDANDAVNKGQLEAKDPNTHASTHHSDGSDSVDHDSLQNYVATKHIDWTDATDNFKTTGNLDVSGSIDSSSAYLYDGENAIKLATKGDTAHDYSSTIVGRDAGDSVTNGSTTRQTALGYLAGNENSGDLQTAIGSWAGRLNSGNRQTALGYFAGQSNSGDHQIAVGVLAGDDNSGDFLTALGHWAGRDNSGDYQTALGYRAGYENQGHRVIGIGYEATTGNAEFADDVVAIGYQAGKDNTAANQFIVKQANVNAVPLIQGDFNSGNVEINGDMIASGNGNGVIVTSPDGNTTKRIGIDNDGNIVATEE